MIKTFREKIRESVQEINKEFNSNFTISELERRLGTSVTPYVVKHTLSELKMEELEYVSGGVNVYNPKLITSAVLALAMATGCVKSSDLNNNKIIRASSKENSIKESDNEKDYKLNLEQDKKDTELNEDNIQNFSNGDEEESTFLKMIKSKKNTLKEVSLKKDDTQSLSGVYSEMSEKINKLSHLLPNKEKENLGNSFIDDPVETNT